MIDFGFRNGRALLMGGVAAVSFAAPAAWAQSAVRVDIPRGEASATLQTFARQTGVQIFAPAEVVRGVTTRPVSGQLTPQAALARMLEGAGLSASFGADGKTVTLTAAATPASAVGNEAYNQVEEVVVTVNKREEDVRKIASSVTAITGRQLDATGAQSFGDYLTRTPGVQFNSAIPGYSTVTIRGVSTTTSIDVGQATTGVYINDIPLTEPFNSAGVPDVDPFDMDRVEVLRGPQGTLFGSATLGGAVNMVARKADPTRFGARIEGSLANVADSGDLSYTAKAMVNIPIIQDKLALRLVGSYRDTAGYLDNVGLGRKDTNGIDVTGGRASLEWRPTDRISVSALGFYSKTDTADAFWSRRDLGERKRTSNLLEAFEAETKIFSLRGDFDLDFATLTVSGAHTQKNTTNHTDFTPTFGPIFQNRSGPIALVAEREARGDLYEARLASKSGGAFEWLVGASYNHIETDLPSGAGFTGAAALIETLFSGRFGAGVGALAAPGDRFTDYTLAIDGVEQALFGEATWRFTPQWRVTAGGRFFKTELKNLTVQSGLFSLLSTGKVQSVQKGQSEEDGFNPKLSLTYEPDGDHMFYGLISKGYRFGGPNAIPQNPAYPSPASFGSDSLTNYEIGARTRLFDRTLTLDATLFYIDWQDIQLLSVRGDNMAYATNVGAARNVGVDLMSDWRPTPNLTLTASVGYLDGKLLDDINTGATTAKAGTRLPGASRWRIASTASYRFDAPYDPTVMVLYRYVSSAPSDLSGTVWQGGYGVLDLRVQGQFGGTRVEGFVENVGDRQGVTVAETNRAGPRIYTVAPRTIGVRVTHDF
jgi:outer membrane receptor protein involved in Fe transport